MVWNATAVDDLFQETMMVAWRRIDQFDQGRPFGPWLRGIAANLVMAYYRKHKRDMLVCNEHVIDRLEEQVCAIEQRRGDTWDEKVDQLKRCISRLSENNREVIELRYLEGRSFAELLDEMGLSRDALKKRLWRAKQLLHKCLARKGVVLEATA